MSEGAYPLPLSRSRPALPELLSGPEPRRPGRDGRAVVGDCEGEGDRSRWSRGWAPCFKAHGEG